MSDTATLVPLHQLVESCTPGEWGDDPVNGSANCVVYRATDIDSEGKLNEAGGAARCIPLSKLLAKSLRPGDILLEASGGSPDQPVGRVALFAGGGQMPALVSNFFRSMRPRTGVDSRFLLQQLVALNRDPAIWRYQQQTTGLTNLKVSDYLTHRLWVPDLQLQRKIAAILTSLDTAIEATEALIEKHQRTKAGLMLDLFTRGVLVDGQLRPASAEARSLYQPTKLGLLPSDWQIEKLGDLVNPARPIVYGILMPGYGFPGGVPVVKVKDIRDRRIAFEDLLLTSPQIDHEYRRSRLKPGDVLFTIRGTVGRVAVVPEELEGANITQDTARMDLTGVSGEFASYYFETPMAKRFFDVNTLGVAVQGINLGELRKLLVPVPPPAEQERIVAVVATAYSRIDSENAVLEKLRMQKQGLMQDLLSGRVSVRPS